MKMLRYAKSLVLLLLVGLCAMDATACTTAMVSPKAAVDGQPILWKNRDTGQGNLGGQVIYVKAIPYSYLAVENGNYKPGPQPIAWAGVNSVGFAIENSDSHNLDLVAQAEHGGADRVASFMAEALRTCATVDDFEALIKRTMGPGVNLTSNYGVIDAHGGSASIEVSLKTYKRFDAKATPADYVLKTNFSWIGPLNTGAGYTRFDRETTLFSKVSPGQINDKFMLETAARDLGSNLLQTLPREEWKTLPAGTPHWVQADFTIDRDTTASTILVHGVRPGEDPQRATLWIVLGEPVCSIAVPLWVAAGETPADVRTPIDAPQGTGAPIANEALRLKHILRPLQGADNFQFVDITKLDNSSGTGWLPGNLKVEQEILDATHKFLAGNPSPEEMAAFEKEMTAKALARLREDGHPAREPMTSNR